jgi:hypothetical protein
LMRQARGRPKQRKRNGRGIERDPAAGRVAGIGRGNDKKAGGVQDLNNPRQQRPQCWWAAEDGKLRVAAEDQKRY